MKEIIKRLFNENKIFIVFFVAALIIHVFLPLNWSDDAVFLTKTADKDIFTFLDGSARPLTDGLTYIFSRNQWLWRILNPCILTTLLWSINKTAPVNCKSKSTQIISFVAVFPTMVLVDAGFVATTVNYLWPVTFGILNLLPLTDALNNRKTNKILLLLLIPLLIYATNMQQICAVLLAVFLISSLYFIIRKKFKPYLILQFIITLCGTVSSLLLNFTGDNSRMVRETGRYFPDFAQLNIFEKTELGFSSTFYCMTMEIRQAFAGFIIFVIYLSFMIFKYNKSPFSKVVSVIPIIFSVVFGIYSLIPNVDLSIFEFVTGGLHHYGMEKAVYSFEIVPDIIFTILFVILIYCICILIENKYQKVFAVLTFMLGLGSRMIMGFSPTVWASGYRTYCIMFISFIYIAIIIADQSKNTTLQTHKFAINNTKVFLRKA